MSATDREIIQKVQQWIIYGDEDLQLAKHGLTLASSAPYRLIAYHAQQCAEKYLKAYLIYYRIDFPYTHNIVSHSCLSSVLISSNGAQALKTRRS